jgi:hypothetical protein
MAFGIGEALTLVSLLATLASGAAKAGGAIDASQEEEAKTRREEEIEAHATKLKTLRERRTRRDQIAKSLGAGNVIDVGEPSSPKPYKTDINPAWGIAGGISDMAASTSAYGANKVGKTPDKATPGGSNKYSNAFQGQQPDPYQVDTLDTMSGDVYARNNRYNPDRIYGGGPLYG